MIDTKDIAWLAGLLEGEGSFNLTRNGIRIQLSMTDEDIIKRAAQITNLGHIHGPIIRPNRKPMWMWYVGRKDDVASILMTIYPLMGQRRQSKIEQLLDIWKSIPKGVCRKGHDKQGLDYCKVCKSQNQIDRRWRNKYHV